jgi:hypothetical protein
MPAITLAKKGCLQVGPYPMEALLIAKFFSDHFLNTLAFATKLSILER